MLVRRVHAVALVAAVAVFMGTHGLRAADDMDATGVPHPIETVTRASKDVVLSFTRPGRVEKIPVKAGDAITQNEVLAQQDSSEEQAEYDFAKAQAEDQTRVDAQVKIETQKNKVLERKKNAPGAVNEWELEEAKLDWEVAVAQSALAVFEHIQDARKLAQAQAVLGKTKLLSPIDGFVQQVYIQEGESVDNQSMRVMRVVNVDPLYIDVPVPFADAMKIKVNDTAHVTYSDNAQGDGVVMSVAPAADPAAGTRNVRLTVKNDAKRPAGERVMVSFESAGKVAAGEK